MIAAKLQRGETEILGGGRPILIESRLRSALRDGLTIAGAARKFFGGGETWNLRENVRETFSRQ